MSFEPRILAKFRFGRVGVFLISATLVAACMDSGSTGNAQRNGSTTSRAASLSTEDHTLTLVTEEDPCALVFDETNEEGKLLNNHLSQAYVPADASTEVGPYTLSIEDVRASVQGVVPVLKNKYDSMPADCFEERWQLLQILADLLSIQALDELEAIAKSSISVQSEPSDSSLTAEEWEFMIRMRAISGIVNIFRRYATQEQGETAAQAYNALVRVLREANHESVQFFAAKSLKEIGVDDAGIEEIVTGYPAEQVLSRLGQDDNFNATIDDDFEYEDPGYDTSW